MGKLNPRRSGDINQLYHPRCHLRFSRIPSCRRSLLLGACKDSYKKGPNQQHAIAKIADDEPSYHQRLSFSGFVFGVILQTQLFINLSEFSPSCPCTSDKLAKLALWHPPDDSAFDTPRSGR